MSMPANTSDATPQPGQATDVPDVPAQPPSRDAANWAGKVSRLQADPHSAAKGDNVTGRKLMGPVQGFGKMWQKTYSIDVGPTITPVQAISAWKADFGSFWPKGNRFYGALTGIAPGDVALLDMSLPGGVRLSTGVMVLYADDESFTLMTPQGHMFAGWITNSAFERDGSTIVQAQVLMRANDPLYETGLMLGGHRKENRFWQDTLEALAAHLGVPSGQAVTDVVCVDKHRQWRRAGNLWHNAAIRSVLQMLLTPVRAVTRRGHRSSGDART